MKNNKNLKALSQQFIQTLCQNKEYRNIPVELMRHFRQQSTISASAVLCWQALYEMAFFDKDWSIQISKNGLAKELNKSPATVARLLNELERHGYIWRSQNKYKGYDLSSRIYVTIPPEAIETISKKPDRKQIEKVCGTIDYSVSTDDVEQIENKEGLEVSDFKMEEHLSDCTSTRCLKNETPKNNINNNINNNSEDNSESDIVVSFFGNDDEEIKSFVPKDEGLNKNENIKVNSTVTEETDVEFDNSKITENQTKIESLKLEVEPLRKKRHEIVESKSDIGCTKMMTKLKEFHIEHKYLLEKELAIEGLKLSNERIILSKVKAKFDSGLLDRKAFKHQKIKTLQAELNMLDSKRNILMNGENNVSSLDDINKLESKSSCIRLEIQKIIDEDRQAKKKISVAYREGQRMLDRKRLEMICYAALNFTGGDKEEARNVAEHVIHAIRFGNLSNLSYKTGKTMTIPLATNVAIKLLRERRWENPKNIDGLVA